MSVSFFAPRVSSVEVQISIRSKTLATAQAVYWCALMYWRDLTWCLQVLRGPCLIGALLLSTLETCWLQLNNHPWEVSGQEDWWWWWRYLQTRISQLLVPWLVDILLTLIWTGTKVGSDHEGELSEVSFKENHVELSSHICCRLLWLL